MAITGTNLMVQAKCCLSPHHFLPDDGKGKGKGLEDHNTDGALAVTNIHVPSGGTQLICSVAITGTANAKPRLVKVVTPNGDTSGMLSAANTLTVNP